MLETNKPDVRRIMSDPRTILLIPDAQSPLARQIRGGPGQSLAGVYVTPYSGTLDAGREYIDREGRLRRCRSGVGAPYIEGVGRPADVADGADLVARIEEVAFAEV